MNAIKLIAEYWSQITLLLLGVGYFIKRVYDHKSKKLEINFTLFQQHKINAVSNFLDSYSKTIWMFNELSFYKVLRHLYTAEQIDEIVFPPLNEMRKSTLEIEIYFDDIVYEDFKIIMTEFFNLNNKIMKMWSQDANMQTLIQRGNELELAHLNTVRLTEKHLNIIGQKIKAMYKA